MFMQSLARVRIIQSSHWSHVKNSRFFSVYIYARERILSKWMSLVRFIETEKDGEDKANQDNYAVIDTTTLAQDVIKN